MALGSPKGVDGWPVPLVGVRQEVLLAQREERTMTNAKVILSVVLTAISALPLPYCATQAIITAQRDALSPKEDQCQWFYERFGQGDYLADVLWDGNRFIAVGWQNQMSGHPLVAIRNDQGEWSVQSLPYSVGLAGIAENGATYVAVGGGGLVLTSSDAVAWTQRESGTTQTLLAVTWGGDKFVAVGMLGTILSSLDGIAWVSEITEFDKDLQSISSNGTSFMATDMSSKVLFSPDGHTWVQRDTGFPEQWAYFSSCVSAGSDYFVAGQVGDVPLLVRILQSHDGSSWQEVGYFMAEFIVPTIYHGDAGFVILGAWGTSYLSPDGAQWTPVPVNTRETLTGAAFSSRETILIGESGNGFRWGCGPAPSVSKAKKLTSPFRLKLTGQGFEQGAKAFIGNNMTAWEDLQVESPRKILLKGGNDLKALFPRGNLIPIFIVNPDGGSVSTDFRR